MSPHAALAGDETSLMSGREGIVNTDAALSKSVRGAVIRGAQVADRLDEKWERFSLKMQTYKTTFFVCKTLKIYMFISNVV